MPKITSCYGDKVNETCEEEKCKGKIDDNDKAACKASCPQYVYGSLGSDLAICGENLYGVKAVLIGGQYIDDIHKTSNNLMRVKTKGIGGKECLNQNDNPQCEIVLLSDFGPSRSNTEHYLRFTSENKTRGDLEPVAKLYPAREAVNITFLISDFGDIDRLKQVSVVRYDASRSEEGYTIAPEYTAGTDKASASLHEIATLCLSKKNEPCTVNIYGVIEKSTLIETVLLDRIDLDNHGLWRPFPSNPKPTCKASSTNTSKYTITLLAKEVHPVLTPEKFYVFGEDTIDFGKKYSKDVEKSELSSCEGQEGCKVSLKYNHYSTPVELSGTMICE